jgi:nickel-dependent lactate racemase
MPMIAQASALADTILDPDTVLDTLQQGLGEQFKGAKLLVLIPDHTRTLPLPFLFRALVDVLRDTRQLDFMVALGTHPPLSEVALQQLVGISAAERTTFSV